MTTLLIQGGEVVTDSKRFRADVLCQNDLITQIGENLVAPAGATIVDAKGKFVFPGFIDPHVHIYLPFMGTYAKDTYESASRAALLGGTTTMIEMCCPARSDDPIEAFDLWMSKAVGKSACDFSFHMGVTKFDDSSPAKLTEIVKRGISSFKIFLAYKGAFGIDDSELYRTLTLAKKLGVIVTAHCENETLVAERSRELLAAGKTDPAQHHESRPPQVEADGVHHLMSFAQMTGAATYIVHLSCAEALERALAARARGVRVNIETLIQYLTLSKSDAERPNFEGAKFVMSPPLRDERNQAVLWKALQDGGVDTVATDHAPFDFATQKQMGRDDFTRIPNGIPSLEDRIKLLYTFGVCKGKIDLCTMVRIASTNAAKCFDLYPRKGAIEVGSDADLVVFDPNARSTISAATHSMNVDYSAFEGWAVQGCATEVAVRGRLAIRGGTFVGEIGRGQFLKRNPSHF
ncbi:MAG: dihydropyrimidinase [Planctomycetota bacterium]|nr:dihydropyrimidinase [Planctomycetota bacterium]